MASPRLVKADFAALAAFRRELRRFLRFSEEAARSQGVTPLQYQLLLQIKGAASGRPSSIGELATRLQAAQHGVVALVTRCERDGLVARTRTGRDRRQVQVVLTPRGDAVVRRVAALHRTELEAMAGIFQVIGLAPRRR